MVQHHGTEPESSTMEEWRVITKNFLVRVFDEYLGCDFDQLSSITLIADHRLRQLLEIASDKISVDAWFESASMSKIAFLWGASNLYQSLPGDGGNGKQNATFGIRNIDGNGAQEIQKAIETVFDKIKDVEQFTAILSSGITILDYKKFSAITPPIGFVLSGAPYIYKKREVSEDEAKWVQEFVVNSIVNWQLAGFSPSVPEWAVTAFDSVVTNGI